MKFSLLTLLAFVGPTNVQSEAIVDRWKLDTPKITYNEAMNIFKLDFTGQASQKNELNAMNADFYDRKCKFDYSDEFNDGPNTNPNPANEYLIALTGIVSVDSDTESPTMQLDTIGNPYLQFQLKTDELAKQSKIYDILDLAEVNADDDLIEDDIGQGRMRMCARTEIGYNNKDATTGAITDFVPVNFIETLITVRYKLEAGFVVKALNVAPKVRVVVTAVKSSYTLEAWLCNTGVLETRSPESFSDTSSDAAILAGALITVSPGRELPKKVVATEPYNQGALLTVCVAPTIQTHYDGIRLSGLKKFTWKRTGNGEAEQAAIVPVGEVNPETILTSYDSTLCGQAEYCYFSSILFADFYLTTGTVAGVGEATLVFKDNNPNPNSGRRLRGVEEGRQLQEDVGDSPFDLSVAVDVGAEGPGAIKTAGGSSYGFSALASAVALLSAALLA